MSFNSAEQLVQASVGTEFSSLRSAVGTVISFDAGQREERIERVGRLIGEISDLRREAQQEREEATEARLIAEEEERQAVDAEQRLKDKIAELATLDSDAAERERNK